VRGPLRETVRGWDRPGSAAAAGERQKVAFYAPWLRARAEHRRGGVVVPLAVETHGAFAPAFRALLSGCEKAAVGDRIPGSVPLDCEGGAAAVFTYYYTQRISIALQRAQAQAWRGFMAESGPDRALEEDIQAAARAERWAAADGVRPDVADLPFVVLEPVV
jgi:hypothetical protein